MKTKKAEVAEVRPKQTGPVVTLVRAPGLCDACRREGELVCLRPADQPGARWSAWCRECIACADEEMTKPGRPMAHAQPQSRPAALAGLVLARWHDWRLADLDRIASGDLTLDELRTVSTIGSTVPETQVWAACARTVWAVVTCDAGDPPTTRESAILDSLGVEGATMLVQQMLRQDAKGGDA